MSDSAEIHPGHKKCLFVAVHTSISIECVYHLPVDVSLCLFDFEENRSASYKNGVTHKHLRCDS